MKSKNQNRYGLVSYQEERERRRRILTEAHLNLKRIEGGIEECNRNPQEAKILPWLLLLVRLPFARRAVQRAGRRVEDHIYQGFLFHQRKGW